MAIVQEAADCSEEGDGIVQLGACAFRGHPAEAAQPLADVGVAETSGTLLNVGLEVEERVAVLGVAAAGQRDEFRSDGFRVAVAEFGDGLIAELGIERFVPADEAEVE
jgi:hypothetical protein